MAKRNIGLKRTTKQLLAKGWVNRITRKNKPVVAGAEVYGTGNQQRKGIADRIRRLRRVHGPAAARRIVRLAKPNGI